jgi:cytochrome P450
MLYNGMGPTLLNMDPPRHVRVRRLMTSAFTPTFVRAREPEIRQIVQHTLNDVCEKGSCDFVVDIAAKIPIAVICEKLGVPRPDWLRMFELTNDIVGEHGDPSDGPRQISALQELLSYFTNMIAEIRRAGASDALISRLAFAQVDGDHLSDEEILWLCATLLLAGNESTRNAMAGGLEALNAHIDQLQLLIDQPWRVSTAVDEMIRWVSPIGHMTRVATHDTEVRGTRIRNGERICMWYLSANRDEEKFERADELDISRDPNPHLGFGTGEHFCLGASFAKLEMRVLFESLIERFPDMALEGSPSRLMSNSFNGYRHMPVTFAPQSPVN